MSSSCARPSLQEPAFKGDLVAAEPGLLVMMAIYPNTLVCARPAHLLAPVLTCAPPVIQGSTDMQQLKPSKIAQQTQRTNPINPGASLADTLPLTQARPLDVLSALYHERCIRY